MIQFELFCNGEKRSIGSLDLPEEITVDIKHLIDGFTPELPRYAFALPGEKTQLKDGQQVLCPYCSSPVLVREPDGQKGVYLVPGAFKTGKGGED